MPTVPKCYIYNLYDKNIEIVYVVWYDDGVNRFILQETYTHNH